MKKFFKQLLRVIIYVVVILGVIYLIYTGAKVFV